MPVTKHYQTLDFEVISNSDDPQAVLCVAKRSDGGFVGRVFVTSAECANDCLEKAKRICDSCQQRKDNPEPDLDWGSGKAGISGLPTI